MSSSYPSSPVTLAAPAHAEANAAGRSSLMDDVALGCECADPALQIACWGQEASPSGEGGQASPWSVS
jgi:hypothetical protein